MAQRNGDDLGHGVRVVAEGNGALVVWAEGLELGWRARTKALPGTGVEWEGSLYEVTARAGGGSVTRWQLVSWVEGQAMRVVERLDGDLVARRAREEEEDRRVARVRRWMVAALPVLGFAPGWMQADWQRRLGYPALPAVYVTGLMEISAGGIGMMQGLSAAFGGGFWLPSWLWWLVVVGPLMGIEGMLRIQYAFAHSEPLGSFLSLPMNLFRKASPLPTTAQQAGLSVHAFDSAAGMLEIAVPTQRPDWAEGGVLPYRGRWFYRAAAERLGSGWLYRFEEVVEGGEEGMKVLRLPPPPAPVEGPPELDRGAGGWLSLTFRTALFCFAPGPLQRMWAHRVGGSALSFTAVGAGMEIFGGLVNLLIGGVASPLALLDIVVLGEGVVRLAALVWTREPVGSVPGQILRPVFERLLRS